MHISPINNSYSKLQSKTNFQTTSFKGTKQILQPINPKELKSDGAKLLYAKIQKYLKLIGKVGCVKDVPLSKYDDSFLSINKSVDKTNIKVTTKRNMNFIDAIFNKDGQMTVGDIGCFHFERSKKNKRIIKTPLGNYTPHGYDDRKWGLVDDGSIDNSSKDNPLLELFLEFARLHTLIFK